MPVIKLTWTEKQTKEEKRQFIEDVAEIVSSAIRVPSEIVNVLICELPKENVRFPEAVFTISWSRHPEPVSYTHLPVQSAPGEGRKKSVYAGFQKTAEAVQGFPYERGAFCVAV